MHNFSGESFSLHKITLLIYIFYLIVKVINTFIVYIFSCISCMLIPLTTAIKDILLGDGAKVHNLLLEIYLRENSKEYSFVVNYDVLIITNI